MDNDNKDDDVDNKSYNWAIEIILSTYLCQGRCPWQSFMAPHDSSWLYRRRRPTGQAFAVHNKWTLASRMAEHKKH